jgi:signal transduction histidine kinase
MNIGRWAARLKTKLERAFGDRRGPSRVALAVVAEQVVREAACSAQRRAVRVRLRAYASPVVMGNRAAIRHALSSVVESAVRYTPACGTVLLQVDRDGKRALIDVVDDGPAATVGDGVALADARSIVSAHGGELGFVEGGGGHVRVELPCSGSDRVQIACPAPDELPAR